MGRARPRPRDCRWGSHGEAAGPAPRQNGLAGVCCVLSLPPVDRQPPPTHGLQRDNREPLGRNWLLCRQFGMAREP
eukprot:9746755-Lingulodinium_polyedra.AAC.1